MDEAAHKTPKLTRERLIAQLKEYEPFNEQEAADRELLLEMLVREKNLYSRNNLHAHMTASAWTVNPARTKVLMCYHNIYNSWSWLGGHADGNENLAEVAIGEVSEESGMKCPRLVSGEIFSLEVLTVDGHVKKGKYVPSHLHLNITYLVEADDSQALSVKADENSGVMWFTPEEAVSASSEPWFRENIYSKLNEKLLKYNREAAAWTEKHH